jgi:carboxylate-amine ligase
MNSLDLDRAAETFATATDLTVGVEEEFALLDPSTLDLTPRFEQLRAAAQQGLGSRPAAPPPARPPPAAVRAGRARGRVAGRHRDPPLG